MLDVDARDGGCEFAGDFITGCCAQGRQRRAIWASGSFESVQTYPYFNIHNNILRAVPAQVFAAQWLSLWAVRPLHMPAIARIIFHRADVD